MGRALGLLGLLVALVAGLYLYTKDASSLSPGGTAPKTTVDLTGARNDLLAVANAERRYFASNGKYASLDELQTNGDIHVPSRASFTYSAEVSDNGFKIVATYSGPDPKAPRRITIDENMSLKEE